MRASFLMVALLGLAGCSDAPRFTTMNGFSNYSMVIPEEMVADQVLAAAKDRCGTASHCTVLGWADPAKAARGLPMTDAEAAAQVFSYSLNRTTGYEQTLWRCTVYPRPNRDECLAS